MSRRIIHLPTLPPRSYQMDFWKAVDSGIKRIILSYPRRAGKDLTCAMYMAREAATKPASYWILAPTKTMACNIYWHGITEVRYRCPIDAHIKTIKGSIMDLAFPMEMRSKTNKSDYMIELRNGSTIKLGGTAEESFVGQTGKGFIITEFSLPEHSDNVLPLLNPIVAETDGWIICNGTQREEDNRLNALIKATKNNPLWYTTYQKMEDTKCTCWISADGKYNINKELLGKRDPISNKPYLNVQDLVDVEPHKESTYKREFCNVPTALGEAGYYENQLQKVGMDAVHNPTRPVYTAWDLGMHDKTCIVFFQIDEQKNPSVIDYYENSDRDVGHYVTVVKNKCYRYGNHFVPVDSAKRSFMLGQDLVQFCKAKLDFTMRKLHKTVSLKADIELVRELLPKCGFNAVDTEALVKALWTYHEDSTGKPCHKNACKMCKGASHAADAFRYMCVAINANLCTPMLIRPPILPTHAQSYGAGQTILNGLPLFCE